MNFLDLVKASNSPAQPRQTSLEDHHPHRPPAAPAAPLLNAPQELNADAGAVMLRDRLSSAYLFSAIDPKIAQLLPFDAFGEYRAGLLKDLGGNHDSLGTMLLEQFVNAHFITMGVQARLAKATSPAEVGILADAAGRLMAECRRSVAAISARQEIGATRSTAAPQKDDSDVPNCATQSLGTPASKAAKTTSAKVESKGEVDDTPTATVPFKKPATRGRRKKKSA